MAIATQILLKRISQKTARQNFILFSQRMENNFYFSLMLVRHRAALNYVLAQWMNIILQQETSQFLLQAALGGNKSKSGRHDVGLMPFHRQFNLLLWCKVILNSDEPIMKNVTSKHHVIYAAWDKNCEVSCWSIILIHWASTQFRAARWRTSISAMEKLFFIDWENRMKFWRAVFEKSVSTISVLLWPLAIHFSAKLV